MTTVSKRTSYTPQQAAAIEARGVSIALSAGAGCGKTFVLTQRFLNGLEPGDDSIDLHSLVAITFTEKAAREMRDRIRASCHARLQHSNSSDAEHWLEVLRGLDAARVSTIHSFCTSLLRANAVEARLDPRFNVLDAALASTLLRNTATQTLHALLEQGDEDAAEFVLQFGLERSRELLRELASQQFQIDFARFEAQSPESIAAMWRTRWETEFVPKLVAEFRSSRSIGRAFELLTQNETTAPAMKARRLALLEWLEPNKPWDPLLPALEAINQNARIQGSSAKHWPSEEVLEAVKRELTEVREAASKLIDLLPVNDEDLQRAAEFSCRAMRLAQRTADAFAAAKQSQGLLDFDDLLLQARGLLRDHPEVRQRAAAGIRLLMVDEFQDTDPVQAEIVRLLCGDALTRGRLFLVGDAKQSIYRFRRADPGVFATLREEIPLSGRLPLTVNFRSQPAVLHFVNHLFASAMGESYEALTPFENVQHSPTPAIEFLLAAVDADTERTEPAPTTIPQSSDSASRDKRLGQATPSASSDTDETSDSAPVRVSADELREREADWIARRCMELLSDPTPRIRTRDSSGRTVLRRVESGDIVILFRALSNVQQYEAALRRFGLDYYLVGGKAFFTQQEVFDLLNLCRYLLDPDDLIALVGILRSPFFNLSDDAIQAISRSLATLFLSPVDKPTRAAKEVDEVPTFLPEEQQRRIGFAQQVLVELRAIKDRVPLSKLLTRAVELTGYDAALLTEHLGSRKVANLRKLIEMADEFDRSELFTLRDFVERLHTSVLDETAEDFATTLPETGNVIRLMTIHQAKGLEFPVVIVADIDRKGPPRSKPAVLHAELGALVKLPDLFGETHEHLGLRMFGLQEREADAEETIRLFYVACTRAADYLILSAGVELDTTRNSPWLELVESRFDLRTGLPKTDALLGSSSASTAGRETIPEILAHKQPPNAKPIKSDSARQVPLAQLADRILTAEPSELPPSARVWPRDGDDLPPLSVSRLEEIDAQQQPTSMSFSRPNADRRVSASSEETVTADTDQATALGSLVHAVLEQIDFSQTANWPALLDAAVRSSNSRINDDVLQSAKTMFDRLLSSSEAKELASAKSLHREVEFGLKLPLLSSRIIGTIDVLYEDAQGRWHIWDYKTNDLSGDPSDEAILAPYEFQLGVYALAVEEWLGESPDEIALVMLRPTIRRVTLAWNPSQRDRLHQRIGRAIEVLRSP